MKNLTLVTIIVAIINVTTLVTRIECIDQYHQHF
jgi:hypothetical protein